MNRHVWLLVGWFVCRSVCPNLGVKLHSPMLKIMMRLLPIAGSTSTPTCPASAPFPSSTTSTTSSWLPTGLHPAREAMLPDRETHEFLFWYWSNRSKVAIPATLWTIAARRKRNPWVSPSAYLCLNAICYYYPDNVTFPRCFIYFLPIF